MKVQCVVNVDFTKFSLALTHISLPSENLRIRFSLSSSTHTHFRDQVCGVILMPTSSLCHLLGVPQFRSTRTLSAQREHLSPQLRAQSHYSRR